MNYSYHTVSAKIKDPLNAKQKYGKTLFGELLTEIYNSKYHLICIDETSFS